MNEEIILLVDDAPKNAEQFAKVLRIHGLDNEVVVAHDGMEALEFLFGTGNYDGRDTTIMPCVILLDVHMPRMDGLETLWHIRADERTRLVPVVMFSATAFPEDVLAAYRLGANAFVDRMSGAVAYPDLVRDTVHFWLAVNQPPPQLTVSETVGR